MRRTATSGLKSRLAAGIAGISLVAAVPGSVLAVGLLEGAPQLAATENFASFTPASADPRLAELIAERSGGKGRMMRFTPAGAATASTRSVTVAVRVDDETAQAISVRSAIDAAREPVAGDTAPRITPTRYNLGMARGYRSFAQPPAQQTTLSPTLSSTAIPDLAEFEPTAGGRNEQNRFAARIKLEDEQSAGRSDSQRLDLGADQSLDVVGSYRLTRNLDVTAGVRYEQDRDRLAPLPNVEKQDSQAVYIGTQFRF